jgi:hypothetical protein
VKPEFLFAMLCPTLMGNMKVNSLYKDFA